MFAGVKVLVEGCLASDSDGRTCPTVSLVQDKNLNIVVDPGTVSDFDLIIKALAKNDLKVSDINLVFLTHCHFDHFYNVAMFKQAEVLDYWGIWKNNLIRENPGWLGENISIINTPGHSYDSQTMLVKTDSGLVAICGDVYWKKDWPVIDEYASKLNELAESRKKILEVADFIIPGHGPIYSLKKDL